MPILVERSDTKQTPRYVAIESIVRKLDQHDFADVDLDIQIRVVSDIRTITVNRA